MAHPAKSVLSAAQWADILDPPVRAPAAAQPGFFARLTEAVGNYGILAAVAAGFLAAISLAHIFTYSGIATEVAEVRAQRAIRHEIRLASAHVDGVLVALLSAKTGGDVSRQYPTAAAEWAAAIGASQAVCEDTTPQAADVTIRIGRLCADFVALTPKLRPALSSNGTANAPIDAELLAALRQLAADGRATGKLIEEIYSVRYASLVTKLNRSSDVILLSASGFLVTGLILFLLLGRAATRHHEASESAVRAQARADRSNQRLFEAIAALPVGFALYDRNERLVLFNKAMSDMTPGGIKVSDVGKTYETLLDEVIQRLRHRQTGRNYEAFRDRHLVRFRQRSGARDESYVRGRAFRFSESRTHDGGTVSIRTDISELKRREAALRASEQRYDGLVNSLRDVVFSLNREARFTFVSASITDMLGFGPDELVARLSLEFVHPDDAPSIAAVLNQLRAERGKPTTFTCRLRRNDGSFVLTEIRLIAPEKRDNLDGELAITGICRDVEVQHEMQRRLREQMEALRVSERRYLNLVNSLRDVVFSMDRELRFTYLSASVTELFGHAPAELCGESALSVAHPDDLPEVARILAQALENRGTTHTITARFRRADGSYGAVEARLTAPDDLDSPDGDIVITGIARDVEAQLEMQRRLRDKMEALRLSERRYFGLVNSLSDPVFSMNREGLFTYVSDKVADLLGYVPAELSQRSVMELFHPDDLPCVADFMAQVRAHRGTPATQTFRFRRKDGGYRLTEIRLTAPEKRDNYGGEFAMTGIARDVEAQHAMQLALNERMERLNSIVQSTGALFVLLDRDLRIVMANNGFLDFVGRREEEIVGRGLGEVTTSPLDADAVASWLGAEAGQEILPVVRDAILPGRNGQRRDIRCTMNAVRGESGRVEHIVILGVDETERRQTELRLIDTSRLATLGEMATGIAHEINQPLATISLAAEAIIEELPADLAAASWSEFRHFVDQKCARIVAQTQRASTIIRDLRGFARKPDEAPVPVEVAPALHTVGGMVGEQLRLAGIKLDYDIDPTCRPVAGHANRLQQVIINLVINARDAILDRSQAGGTIAIRARDLGDADKVVITVEDDGRGIPDHALPRLFEPFFTTKPTGKGTGLGLSISYQIIRQMGGTILAQNRAEGGARFTVTLAIAPGGAHVEGTPITPAAA